MQSCWCHCCSNTFRRKDVISCKRNRICIHWIIRLFFVRFFFTYSRLNCLNPEKELLCISVIELWLRILQKKFHSNKNIQELILYLLKRPQPRNQNSNYFAWCATSLVQAFLPYVTLYLHIIALILRNLKTSKMSRWGQTGKYNILQETKWIWRISGLIYVLEMSCARIMAGKSNCRTKLPPFWLIRKEEAFLACGYMIFILTILLENPTQKMLQGEYFWLHYCWGP